MTALSQKAAALVVVGFALQGCNGLPLVARLVDSTPLPAPRPVAIDVRASEIESAIALAKTQRLEGDYDAASWTLTNLFMAAPDDPRVLGEYGKLLVEKGEGAAALPYLSRAIQLSPNDWTLYSAQGVALDQIPDHGAALASYEHALKLSPDEASVLSNAGLSRMAAGDLAGAERYLARAAEQSGSAEIATRLTEVRRLQGSRQNAGASVGDQFASPANTDAGTAPQNSGSLALPPSRIRPSFAENAENPEARQVATQVGRAPNNASHSARTLEELENDPTVVVQRLPD